MTNISADLAALPTETLSLTTSIINSFKPTKLFRTHIEPLRSYTSVSFDDKGECLLTASEDDHFQVFLAKTGQHSKKVSSKKYGAHLARFTHSKTSAIHASTKVDDAIRLLSLHKGTYERYFKGHTAKVSTLDMSPVDDQFLSAAADDTVRLWDLRSQNCQGLLHIPGHPTAAFDPTGAIFAVALHFKSTLLMYDMRNFDKAPFHSETINDPVLVREAYPPKLPVYTALKFSNNGAQILAVTSGPIHYVLDSFNGTILARLSGHTGFERFGVPASEVLTAPRAGASCEEACWTPDSRYVFSGTPDGSICIWDVNPPDGSTEHSARPALGPECTLEPTSKLAPSSQQDGGPSRAVAFNPRLGMFVSAGLDLTFWLPADEKISEEEPTGNAAGSRT